MSAHEVQVVIPHHSRWDLLQEALQSCAGQRVLVVDDSSLGIQGSLEEGVEVLRTPGGLGFARAANKGLEHAESQGVQWTLLLNDDARLRPGAIENLLRAVERHPKAEAFGPLLVGPEGVESAGICLSPRTARLVQRTDVPQEDRVVMALSGACLLVRSKWRFCESFVHAMEDVELGLRIRQSGSESVLVASARCWHQGGGTLRRDSPRATREAVKGHLRLVGGSPVKRILVLSYAFVQVLKEGPRLSRMQALLRGWREA